MDRLAIRYHSVFGERANTACICEGGESAVLSKSKRGIAFAVNYPGYQRQFTPAAVPRLFFVIHPVRSESSRLKRYLYLRSYAKVVAIVVVDAMLA